jgi:Family of unknown function (DUF6629)
VDARDKREHDACLADSEPDKVPPMCFSAMASFSAAAVIGGVGVATMRQAISKHNSRLLPLAAFPLMFSLQQMVEGLLWLELDEPEPGALRGVLVHAFQGYAEVFWPAFAPLAAWLIEPDRLRRGLIALCLAVGVALSIYLLVMMIAHPYEAFAAGGHIVYRNDHRYPVGIEAPYVVATTISLLLSSHQGVRLPALVILIGFGVAYLSFHQAYISVWCFFAALASVLVYLHVRATPAHGALGGTP